MQLVILEVEDVGVSCCRPFLVGVAGTSSPRVCTAYGPHVQLRVTTLCHIPPTRMARAGGLPRLRIAVARRLVFAQYTASLRSSTLRGVVKLLLYYSMGHGGVAIFYPVRFEPSVRRATARLSLKQTSLRLLAVRETRHTTLHPHGCPLVQGSVGNALSQSNSNGCVINVDALPTVYWLLLGMRQATTPPANHMQRTAAGAP